MYYNSNRAIENIWFRKFVDKQTENVTVCPVISSFRIDNYWKGEGFLKFNGIKNFQ